MIRTMIYFHFAEKLLIPTLPCTSFDLNQEDVPVAIFCLKKGMQNQICNLIESIISSANWEHKNDVLSVVKTNVKDVQSVVLVFMITVTKIGMAFAKLPLRI